MKKIIIITTFLLLEISLATDTSFQFTNPFYNVSIPENSVGKHYAVPLQEKIGISLQHSFTEIKFKIINGDKDKIFKAEEKIVGNFCFLFIRTKTGSTAVLNRERKNKFILEIKANGFRKDGKQKIVLEADTIIEVKILDTNDLNPLFYPTEYETVIPEDYPLHQSIVKVLAEDADLGINGEIYYSIADDTTQFAINPTSGILTLTRPLKYILQSYYELSILAQDRGPSLRSKAQSKAKVKIRIKQVNLYAPEIKVQHLPQIIENSYSDIYAIVNVTDKDFGTHGEIKSLEIVSGDPDGHFRIRPSSKNEFYIEVLKILDRETTPQGYQLKLRAVDKGVPSKESYKSVSVQLADLNDNIPVFSKEIYDVKVYENVPINTPLIRLKVSDKDEGKNAQVFLQIVGGNEGNEFFINPESGVLYTATKLDAEQKAFYSLTVSAIDQGNIGTRKQSSAKVKINILDRNDCDPVFERPELTVFINENEPAGTSVTKVVARDRDSGENAYISYSIVNLKPVPFEIDPFTGIVKTTQLIDYESMRRKYVLRLRASDWGLPYRRQAEMQLTIKIKDLNDNRPQFEKIDCQGHVPRFVPIGSEIITMAAVDFDAGNIISYRIISGNEDGCFSLDSTAGTLAVNCDLNELHTDERMINVTATDGTNFADPTSIHFFLVDVKRSIVQINRIFIEEIGSFDCKDTGVARRLNEILTLSEKNNEDTDQDFLMLPSRYGQNIHSPEFLEFPSEIKVNESVNLGTTLVKIKARDRDLGYNGKINFVISNGDPDSVFCVDLDSGELKIIGYLDREKREKYILNITIYDMGKPQKHASKQLPITVLDVNDHAPKFEKTLASYKVTENALNGTIIFTANATDLDQGDNAKITYSLSTDTKDFAIDHSTGVLFICNKLDRERQDLYELKIKASDNPGKSSEALYSEALVRIIIDDVNDNVPKFGLKSYSFRVREDVPRGTVVAVIEAFDPDIGPEGQVVYSLKEEDGNGTFKIDKLSGTIRTAKLLDYETSQVHQLKITASDLGTPSLSSTTDATIVIVDVNENLFPPVFSEPVLMGSVYENRPVGTVVLKVNVSDNDHTEDDKKISFYIKGGDGLGYFSINNEVLVKTKEIKPQNITEATSTITYEPKRRFDWHPSINFYSGTLGGFISKQEDHPFVVRITSELYSNLITPCVGALIKPTWVLTSAVCVHPELQMSIVVSTKYHTVFIPVTKIVMHPNFTLSKIDVKFTNHDREIIGISEFFKFPYKAWNFFMKMLLKYKFTVTENDIGLLQVRNPLTNFFKLVKFPRSEDEKNFCESYGWNVVLSSFTVGMVSKTGNEKCVRSAESALEYGVNATYRKILTNQILSDTLCTTFRNIYPNSGNILMCEGTIHGIFRNVLYYIPKSLNDLGSLSFHGTWTILDNYLDWINQVLDLRGEHKVNRKRRIRKTKTRMVYNTSSKLKFHVWTVIIISVLR